MWAEAAAELMLQWPDAPPPYRGRRRDPVIRTWHLGKFPYNLIHTVREGEVFMLAYAPAARRPGDLMEHVRELVSCLSPLDREITELVFWEGFRQEQVATILGKPSATIRSRLSRARAALCDQLAESDDVS